MGKNKRVKKINIFYPYIKEVFYILDLALIIFVIMEIIKPKIVLGYINLSLVLVLWLISAILLIIIKPNDR